MQTQSESGLNAWVPEKEKNLNSTLVNKYLLQLISGDKRTQVIISDVTKENLEVWCLALSEVNKGSIGEPYSGLVRKGDSWQ